MSREQRKGAERGAGYRMRTNPETQLKEADDHRTALHRSALALVEDTSVSAGRPPPAGYESHYQIVLPYFGLFAYVVGRRRWLLDSNRVLFISPGWEFHDEHPIPELGHAAVLVNPSREILDEVCGRLGASGHNAFAEGSRPSTLQLMLLTQQMLHAGAAHEDLRKDEWTVHALRAAFAAPAGHDGRSSRVVDRAKQVLHARSCERLCLDDVARDVGVSPAYLTQEFSRTVGLPLYRYQIRLRLSRALLELPHCGDITGLALDLGFSSHSHFTCCFREVFGMTPSQYRSTIGTRHGRPATVAPFEQQLWPSRKAA